jgi:hypothetical protein
MELVSYLASLSGNQILRTAGFLCTPFNAAFPPLCSLPSANIKIESNSVSFQPRPMPHTQSTALQLLYFSCNVVSDLPEGRAGGAR